MSQQNKNCDWVILGHVPRQTPTWETSGDSGKQNCQFLLTLVLNYGNGSQSWTITYQVVFWTIGFATKHFNLGRGVRQGCPLSGILFVIGVETLSNAIKRSKKLEGIQIDPNKSIKITQYANHTTVFVKDIMVCL